MSTQTEEYQPQLFQQWLQQKNAALSGLKFRKNNTKGYLGFLFILPVLIVVGLFFITPLIMTAWMSFYKWPLFGKVKFIGLTNYLNIIDDDIFWHALKFTFMYAIIITPLIFILSMVMASLVKENHKPGVAFFRSVYFLPTVIGFGAASIMWRWLLDPRYGLLNHLGVSLGVFDAPVIYQDSFNASFCVVIAMVLWKTAGFNMILLLVGLQGIDKDIYHAAQVDGATGWRRLRYITLPLMRRTFMLTLILSVSGSLLAFDQFYIITNGGPMDKTITNVFYIYNNSFLYGRMGYGAALSIVQLFILMVISILQIWFLRDKEGRA
ncbi:carbohydrate ABC transporter permease [Superficieibacter sp. 1612_C1]|uniref:carbohydrate ABC transporter permease n=1 Tax=Superficieibacter sp. 1612_C1 TaxID=2780382 RepID=UPI001884378B|nr:sugar ABC transporter permease [Superficieibacter sp. 1612_C1]